MTSLGSIAITQRIARLVGASAGAHADHGEGVSERAEKARREAWILVTAPAAQPGSRRSRRCPKCRTGARRKPLVQAKESYIED